MIFYIKKRLFLRMPEIGRRRGVLDRSLTYLSGEVYMGSGDLGSMIYFPEAKSMGGKKTLISGEG